MLVQKLCNVIDLAMDYQPAGFFAAVRLALFQSDCLGFSHTSAVKKRQQGNAPIQMVCVLVWNSQCDKNHRLCIVCDTSPNVKKRVDEDDQEI